MIQRAVSGYVRGQLLFSLIMGTSATVGLWLFGVLGIFPDGQRYAAVLRCVLRPDGAHPVPGAGARARFRPCVVALFTDPVSALWVVLLFVGLQQLEGHFVAPQVFRISLGINPIIVILALLFGYQVYGIVGALLALPLAAMIRQTVVYLRQSSRARAVGGWGAGRPRTRSHVAVAVRSVGGTLERRRRVLSGLRRLGSRPTEHSDDQD